MVSSETSRPISTISPHASPSDCARERQPTGAGEHGHHSCSAERPLAAEGSRRSLDAVVALETAAKSPLLRACWARRPTGQLDRI